jgi:hypothetical protein
MIAPMPSGRFDPGPQQVAATWQNLTGTEEGPETPSPLLGELRQERHSADCPKPNLARRPQRRSLGDRFTVETVA